jgi:hypothetical protein
MDIEQINYTYKLMKGSDGYLYVSIQPLMKDIANSITALQKMDVKDLNEEDYLIYELKIKGLVTIYEFLGGFITEQQLKDKQTEIKGNITLNVGSVH